MKQYELMVLIPNRFTEDEVKTVLTDTTKILDSQNVQIIDNIDYGKRKLAYPIQQNNHAYYQLIQFDAEPQVIETLNSKFGMSTEILRHLIIQRNLIDPHTVSLTQDTEDGENREHYTSDKKKSDKSIDKTHENKQKNETKKETTPVAAQEESKKEEVTETKIEDTKEEQSDKNVEETNDKEEQPKDEIVKEEEKIVENTKTEDEKPKSEDTKNKLNINDLDQKLNEILEDKDIDIII